MDAEDLQDMKTTVTSAEAKAHFSRLLRSRRGRRDDRHLQTRRDRGLSDSTRRLEALVETMEILGNATAMRAIRQHEAGKLSFHPVSALDEDEG